MQQSVACAAFIVLLGLCACGKRDNALPSGIGADGGTSGPPGTYLSSALAIGGGDSTWNEIRFNSDHSVAKVITIHIGLGGTLGDTTYTTIIPVYAGGKLSALQSPSDSLAGSGPVTTLFDYTAAGVLQRIRYNPGAPGYAYDSLIMGTSGLLAQSFHFVTDNTTGAPTQLYSEAFTWNSKMDIQQILITNIDTSNGSISSLTASYTYDGFFNPYKTVKDLPFMLGTLDNVLPIISANNATSAQLVGFNSSNNYIYQYTTKSLPSSQNIQILQGGALKQSSFVYFQYIAQN
jgi:hypothetical protein